jgi:hypothetical protein
MHTNTQAASSFFGGYTLHLIKSLLTDVVVNFLLNFCFDHFFMRDVTQYKHRYSYTYEYSLLWINACTPYPYEHFWKTEPAWSLDSWSHSKSILLSIGTSPTTKRIISRKYATSTPNLGFKLGWVGSTTRNLTIWARLSLLFWSPLQKLMTLSLYRCDFSVWLYCQINDGIEGA